MTVLIIDGQGGGIGRMLVEELKKLQIEGLQIYAVGTNALATQAMLRSGANEAATGENPVRVLAPQVDVILGPMGIVLCDAMLGEITEGMAVAIGRSPAQKILIPLARCGMEVAGLPSPSLADSIRSAAQRVEELAH
ncbi:MAG: DUF3842 family protein [Christensenellaceae bacterium]|jgi:NAD(P)-dependent dehydrogenase (short-subunit alcohol dehydrogenase family)|nr:DUF3842 family protein [Christensenellaceae bacterium]